jgi:hypothetical protein
MLREDTKPWYRQFWPWFIIALPASSVVAGLTTVWISLQTSDSLVAKSDDGMQVVAARRISAEHLANELGLSASLEFNRDTGTIAAVMRTGDLETIPATLELELTHPAFAERDQLLTLNQALPDTAGNPVWVGHFVTVPAGRWYVALKSGDDWRVAGEWQGESQLTLRPANRPDDEH